MSNLDTIMKKYFVPSSDSTRAAAAEYREAKEEIKKLMLELIGEDERVAQTEDMSLLARLITRNGYKAELRARIREL